MLEKLKKNKKALIAIVILLLVMLGIVIGVLVSKDSKKTTDGSENSNINIETENGVNDNNSTSEEIYNGDGLEVQEEDNGTVENRTDLSGTWGEGEKITGNNNQESNDDNTKEEEPEEEEPEDELLVDDKDWGRIF